MAYLPVLLGALAAFSWGTSDYLSRSSSQKVGHYRTTVYMHVFSTATLVLLLPLLRPDFGISFELVLTLVAVSFVNFFGFTFAPLLKQDVRPRRDIMTRTILVMGILETFGLLSFNLGISFGSGSLPVVTALSGMGGAFATTYAMTFLREKLEPNQLVGILLSIAGVFALLYLTS